MDRKHRLLIVEDSEDSMRHLQKILEKDYRIESAVNGTDALDILKKDEKPDLIILDVMMPGMDGYELCSRIKEDEKTRNLPVIFISARNNIDDEMKPNAKL